MIYFIAGFLLGIIVGVIVLIDICCYTVSGKESKRDNDRKM